MKNVHIIAHTHWDYEWYFTRQEARVQFAYHLNEVLEALNKNKIDYYLLDGQMAIVDDYLEANPDKKAEIQKLVAEKRLFIGPWYTQIDELITSGESIVRNLQLGIKSANKLGGAMKVGYLPDSFGQSQDMPKIYQGFGINEAVFWRGIPRDKNARYFYWSSDDASKVLVSEIRNSYAVGADLIDTDNYMDVLHKIATNTDLDELVLPLGGDQRSVDFNLKQRIDYINKQQDNFKLIEDNYPSFFDQIKDYRLPTYQGEFIEPTVSKIHRGIYSSRADIKQLYSTLENEVINEIEPLMAIAKYHGIDPQKGMISLIWKTISRGKAHDSSGGCNSDETNRDIKQRGIVALQMADALKFYILRKLSSNVADKDQTLYLWNVQPYQIHQVAKISVTTKNPQFSLYYQDKPINFDIIKQQRRDASNIRRNEEARNHDYYYVSDIALLIDISPCDWISIKIKENVKSRQEIEYSSKAEIENKFVGLELTNGKLKLIDKIKNNVFYDFLSIEDGGDEGDTYDYSPAYKNEIVQLNFENSEVKCFNGEIFKKLQIDGFWKLPGDLNKRAQRLNDTVEKYTLNLILKKNDPIIYYDLSIDNKVKDHRLRLLLHTPIKSNYSYADTAFGISKRLNNDKDLKRWKQLGYHEEPTSIRPMIHYVNMHDAMQSWTYLSNGQKAYQIIGDKEKTIAITLFRCVGFQGRPDLLRRPSDASGLINKWVPTDDAQLQGLQVSRGRILLTETYDPVSIQKYYRQTVNPVMYYQNQKINEYSTPLQHFRINKTSQVLDHKKIICINTDKLVYSSLYLAEDTNGIVVRVYNPSKSQIVEGGTIQFGTICNVAELDLNNSVKKSLCSAVTSYNMGKFNTGQIKTFGIFPIEED